MKFRGVAKLGIKASGGNYDQAVLNLNPTAFWKFDEDASPSVYADSSGNGHDLTFEQGVLRQTPLAKGSRFAVGGDAIGRITQGDPDNLPSMSTVSIGTWLNGNTLDQIDHILSMDDDVGNDRSFQFRTNGLLVEWIIVDTAGADTLSSSSGLSTGTTAFVVVTYDGSTMRLYIDGSEDNTLSTTRPMDDYTTVPSTQLGDGPGGIPFDGILDGMFVFADTVLTATQISDLYTAGTR